MTRIWNRGFFVATLGALSLLLSSAFVEAWARTPGDDGAKTVEGRVQRLTTAPRGETDGAVLDDGTTIHWPPHLGDRVAEIVAKGDRIRATGRMETGPEDDTHLEIQSVRNLSTRKSFDRDDDPPPPRADAAGSRGRNFEDRLRALEDEVRRLSKEIEHLKNDR
jgi:hypothetical protein